MKTSAAIAKFPAAAVILVFYGLGCAPKVSTDPQYVPAAGLMEILKDFQRHSRDDLYRFPVPKDVTGANILKATLLRLEDYEKKHANRFSDIIHFSKAAAYERLRDYDRAVLHYRKVAESDGRLGEQAENNLKALEAFRSILREPLPARDPFEYIKALDDKVQAWNDITRIYQGTHYEYLARIEEERLDRAKVAFVELNRQRLKNGDDMVILGYGQLVTKHRESKRLYRHLLDFGDYYVKLAHEYASRNDPEGLTFEPETFDGLAKSGLNLYMEVVQQDGIVEKIEAEGKIRSLRATMQKMRRLNR